MTTHITQQKPTALCTICGGERHETTITHEEQRGDTLYIFHNVPATVCSACGEVWIDEEVLEQIGPAGASVQKPTVMNNAL